jgi:SAM-dependent methyltransferase
VPAPLTLATLYPTLPKGAAVLDVGCFGYRQVAMTQRLGLHSVRHAGVDYNDYTDLPDGFEYRKADLGREGIPFENDRFDLVVANHVVEHVAEPIRLVGECLRVCRPGGIVYIEAPSERSLWLPGMPYAHDKFFSLSFFDDPTHVGRPWSPQAFVRLARYFGCEPIEAGYRSRRSLRMFASLAVALVRRQPGRLESAVWNLVGWASYAAVRKPATMLGMPPFHYYIPQDR